MTNQEAIADIEKSMEYGVPDGLRKETLALSKSTLEKQIPKKPNLCMNEQSGMFVDYADGHGEYKVDMNNWWRCPCCNEVVGQRGNRSQVYSRPTEKEIL